MYGARAICIAIFCGLTLVSVVRAEDADSIKQTLDSARSARADACSKARTALFDAFDRQIKSASQSGNLEGVRTLTAQKDAFTASGVAPTSPMMKDAAAQYDEAVRSADGRLAAAFEDAIEGYTRLSLLNEAMEARRQRRLLLESTAEGPAAGGPVSPESVAAALDQAKGDYGRAVADAQRSLLAAIDSRIAGATQAGDLKTVTALRPARASTEADGSLPPDLTDPAVLAAKSRSSSAIQLANLKLATAYRQAIRGYTRAGKIDEAQGTQAEFDSLGLPSGSAGGTTAGPSTGVTYPLARNLPDFLTASTYSAVGGGIRLDKKAEVKSKNPDFFTKDFVFDVVLDVAAKSSSATVGIGEGNAEHSIGIIVRSPDDRLGVGIIHKDPYGDKIGRISEPATYIVRLEKRGSSLTFSVGGEKDGKFTADITHTIPDYKTFAPHVNEKSGHLYFRGDTVFRKVRLAIGPGATISGGGTSDVAAMPTTPVNLPLPKPSLAAPQPPPAPTPEPLKPATVTVTLAATPKLEPGLLGQFYGDSKLQRLVKTRVDERIDFDWAKGVAPEAGVPTPHYSIRWTGQILIPAGGASAIGLDADDGARLMIDGEQVLAIEKPARELARKTFAAGMHTIEIQYWNKLAGGRARLLWSLNGAAEQPVAATALFHAPAGKPSP